VLARHKKIPGSEVAIKMIEKKSVKGTPTLYLKREVAIIK